MHLTSAQPSDAPRIATLVMEAMNHECCQHFAGPHHTLDDFHRMMTALIRRDDTQYSYRNALVARDDNDVVAGVIIGYDGKDLHRLRRVFLEAAKECFGMDHSDMDDETQAGEFYLDSLAVDSHYRHQGIGTALLQQFIEMHATDQPVGLLVDKGNPKAEKLYQSLGFEYVGDARWGGHELKHLQKRIKK